MNATEFSNQFDVTLQSYLRFKKFDEQAILDSIDLNEYEKSLYLTNAQNDLIVELYSGRNRMRLSFEQTEELRRYLSSITKRESISTIVPMDTSEGLDNNSVEVSINDDVLFIVEEQCKVESSNECLDGKWVECLPIRHDEYHKIKNNPFKNKKVWRVDIFGDKIELVSKHSILEYKVTYLKRPQPIILEDITPETIQGVSTVSSSELDPILHNTIVEMAVQKAIMDIVSKVSKPDN